MVAVGGAKDHNDGCGGFVVMIGNGGKMEFEEQHASRANANSTTLSTPKLSSFSIFFESWSKLSSPNPLSLFEIQYSSLTYIYSWFSHF